jgi:hypothetical protein
LFRLPYVSGESEPATSQIERAGSDIDPPLMVATPFERCGEPRDARGVNLRALPLALAMHVKSSGVDRLSLSPAMGICRGPMASHYPPILS